MRFFFGSSATFQRQLRALYDLINPSLAAMWNLRWQVRGYVDQRPDATNDELHGRFVAGSGIGSANLRRQCVESTWEEQADEPAVCSPEAVSWRSSVFVETLVAAPAGAGKA